jgi:hypothetical protein
MKSFIMMQNQTDKSLLKNFLLITFPVLKNHWQIIFPGKTGFIV